MLNNFLYKIKHLTSKLNFNYLPVFFFSGNSKETTLNLVLGVNFTSETSECEDCEVNISENLKTNIKSN